MNPSLLDKKDRGKDGTMNMASRVPRAYGERHVVRADQMWDEMNNLSDSIDDDDDDDDDDIDNEDGVEAATATVSCYMIVCSFVFRVFGLL